MFRMPINYNNIFTCLIDNHLFSVFNLINYNIRCSAILCKPTGGKAKLTPGCAFRLK